MVRKSAKAVKRPAAKPHHDRKPHRHGQKPHKDLIRIVPLHRGAIAAERAAAPPQLTYRNGPLIGAVEVFTVFWGDGWSDAPQSALIPKLNAFFDFILGSALMDQLSEDNVDGSMTTPTARSATSAPG